MTQHEIIIDYTSTFEILISGRKKMELRINDELVNTIKLGDRIIFINKEDGRTAFANVKGLCLFPNFDALIAVVGRDLFGWADDYPTENYDEYMMKYYTAEQIEKYGALGIVIKLADKGSNVLS